MKILFLQFFQVLIQRLSIRLMYEPIFNIDLIEEADHVLRLITRCIEFLNSIENHSQDYFMGEDSRFLKEMFVAVLDALDRAL